MSNLILRPVACYTKIIIKTYDDNLKKTLLKNKLVDELNEDEEEKMESEEFYLTDVELKLRKS